MDAILFDLDGVFYQGNQLIAGADQIARWVQTQQIPHLFVTNTTSIPRRAIVEKLAHFGIATTTEHVFTPPVAASRWLQQQGKKHLRLLLPEATTEEFSEFMHADENVDAIVVGDLGEQWNYQKLNDAFRLLMQQHPPVLIALGMTRYWKAEDGLRLDVAPFVQALSFASGIEPVIMGKPDKHFFSAALSLLEVGAENTLMIGDDIRGDIQGSQQLGIHAALVKTGKFREADLLTDITPDYIIESVTQLPQLWQQLNTE